MLDPIELGKTSRDAVVAAALLAAVTLVSPAGPGAAAQDASHNGFDLTDALVAAEDVHVGTFRDAIEAIDRPAFVPAGKARHLEATDRVLGLVLDGAARAYPLDILDWHEVVNDTLAGARVVVSWCPLCGSGTATRAEVGGRRLTFGVSGLLYNSDLLLYDRQTESLWSQIEARAVAGPLRGSTLDRLPVTNTTWADWSTRHPQSEVLVRPGGRGRPDGRDPYPDYATSDALWYPVLHESGRYPAKSRVLGLVIDGQAKVWPFEELQRTGGEVVDTLGGQAVVIRYDARHRTASAFDADGRLLPGLVAYWFAWYAFHPGAEVFSAGATPDADDRPGSSRD